MENSNDKTKDLEQENSHPAPNADPGAEIETVIPSAEKEAAPANSSDKPASEQDQERVGAGDNADDIEPKDKPEITEEEKDEPEIKEEKKDEPETAENEGGESKTDEHGIETISP